MSKVPVRTSDGKEFVLTAGEHSQLIRDVIEEFAPRFTPGAFLVYAGDTGAKWGHSDDTYLTNLGVSVDTHGKMPDVLFHYTGKNWLVVVECVTSHGPVDAKRHSELEALFAGCKDGLVYVTAFPSRRLMAKYVSDIAWETEVWVAEAPSHLIHFNGSRFLGPH